MGEAGAVRGVDRPVAALQLRLRCGGGAGVRGACAPSSAVGESPDSAGADAGARARSAASVGGSRDAVGYDGEDVALIDLLDRLLGGVVLTGDITLAVADIDLVYVGLRALISSVASAEEAGVRLP